MRGEAIFVMQQTTMPARAAVRTSCGARAAAGLAAFALLLAGCGRSGPPIAPVCGAVRVDGKPLAEGNVSFFSAEGFASSAPVKSDGTFRLGSQYGKGIPLGTYHVAVSPPGLEGPVPMIPTAASAKQRPSIIPLKYRNVQSSDLTAVVKTGGGSFNFDLQNTK